MSERVSRLARKLSDAWIKYRADFGAEPHGTEKQLAALIELAGGEAALDAPERAAPRQEVDCDHPICEHGRNAYADDCGMCELAGTDWAAPPSVSPQATTAALVAAAPSQEGVGQGGTAEGADWVRMARNVLVEVQKHVCSFLCPSVKNASESWFHTELCHQLQDLLSAAPRPDALVERYKWLLEHAQSGGFMPRAVNEVRIDVTVLEGQRLSLKRLTGKELDAFIVAALEAARALGRGEAGEAK